MLDREVRCAFFGRYSVLLHIHAQVILRIEESKTGFPACHLLFDMEDEKVLRESSGNIPLLQ